jgi:hypothetical protein
VLAAALLLASCGDRHAATEAVRQTGLPGMETAGGHTSGEAMAAASAALSSAKP